ncbi:uncharacterized protein si:ch211-180a12.2 [Scomber japonicus]|uniref:uncharacterized protein si:ch211-180a12.2 n=1 Tax=Scomber japonicus TaxID=13676 RepID=UPI002305FFD9|nr:uncharacterized protein si:ch211-180a12.2 [Scomber japonicus]
MQCKVLICVVLLTLKKHVSPTEIQTGPNTNATLPCNVTFPLSVTGDIINKSLIEVNWTRNDSDIASFGKAQDDIKEGFSWNTSDFVNGDFSLTILRASFNVQGLYECTVSYNSKMLHLSNVTFSILASPTLSIPQQWVVLETKSQLECYADGFYPPPVSFSWSRDGQEIPSTKMVDSEQTADGYYRAVGNLTFYPSREDQNATFGCKVLHSGSYQELDFQINITYLPSVKLSVMPSSSNDIPLTLYCDVESFYPEEMSVSWFQNGTVLSEPPDTEKNPDGTYRTRRYYTLSPEQREQGGNVECAVNQPGVQQPSRGSVYLSELDHKDEALVLTKSAKASVAMMCISIVLVFLLCFGFSWRRRDEKQKSLSVSGIILPPRVTVGQKGRVTVSIEGRRVDRVQTAWFLNDTPISDTSLTVSEKGPLLPSRGEMGYYKLHTEGPLHSSGSATQQLVSSLTFIPQISIHKGAVFKCQVFYLGKEKIVAERVSEKFTILYIDLNISGYKRSHSCNFCPPDIMSLTVRASHFHPDIITFRWFCEGGELSPVASQASSSPRPNSDGFFSASSQCKLPRSELEMGGTKVWVSVHHIALKQPVTRETRGFIKRPCVSEIVGSTFSPEQALTLGCEITDFYPPNISVTWLKLREGEQDDREEEVIEGGEMWGPIQTQPKLFRASAILKRNVTNQEKKERGGGIVCRVEHCSLQEPIERQWRNGGIETKAAITDPNIQGIEYIDEDGENNNIDRDEETKSDVYENSDEEQEEDSGALHINRVNLTKGPRENERARLRVCVEITHPSLKLPVYRTWTETKWSKSQRGGSLKMDPDSPIARVERTFWNVWNYITVAVNRFLRPVPTDIVSNEPNSLQESAVDSEPANCGHTVGDTCRGQVDEEQGLAAASLLSSSRPVVAWELCTTEINLGHDEENRQDKCQLSRGSDSKASEEGDGTREGQFTQSGNDGTGLLIAEDAGTKEDEQVDSRGSERKSSEEDDDMREEQFTQSGNDDAGPLIAKATGPKEDEQEENKGWKLDIPERDGIEGHANTVSLNAADDAMSEDIEESGRKEGDEEESGRAMTQEDPQKMDETVTNIQIQEEHSEMQCEVEHDNTYSHTVCSVEAEETEVKLCTLTDLSLKEDATHVEAETAVTPEEVETSDSVLQVASENENNRQAENLLSVCEELSDVDRNLECGPSVVSSDATLMADDKSVILSDDDQIVKGQEQVMLERTEMIMYDIAEDEKEEDESAVDFEEHSVVIMEENVNELAGTTNNKTSDEVPEQENDIETVTEDNQEEDFTTECVACSEDFTQTATTELYKAEFTDGEQEHVAEDTEVKTKTTETDDVEIKSYGAVNDEKSDGNKAGAEQERLLNEDDNNEECMEIACATTAVTVKPDGEAGQEISREFKNIPPGIFESGMEAEKTEVKLCTLTDLSLKEDATCVEAERAVTPEEVENSDGVLQLASENENNRQAENLLSVCEELSDVDRDLECGPSVVSSDATLMADDKSVILSDDDQIVKGQEQMMLERTEMIMYDIAEDEKEEDESTVDFEEHSVVIKEENVNELAGTTNNKTSDEVPEQENDMETVTEDNQEEDITTECVACSEDFTQSATTELYKAEFTDGEQEHVAEDTEVKTKTTETDDVEIKSYGAVNDEKSDGNKAGAEQERLLNEDDNNEECMEIACATTAVTVKPDGEAGQEISREFKNIPPGIFESGMEAEKTEVKLCTLTDLSLKEDATCVEAERAVTPEEVENSDGVLQLASENENRQAENLLSVCEELSDVDRDLECGPSVVSSDATLMADDKSVILSDDDQIVKGQEQVMLERTEMIMYDIAEDEKEEEDESAVYDEEHGVIMEENVNELAGTTNNKTSDEVPEQENDIETVTEDNQEEDITTECVACSEDFKQIATTELYKAEFADGVQEHVAEDTEVKTKTRETDNVEIKRHGAVIDEKSDGNKAGAEEERLLNEDDNNEGCLEIACATTVVTVKPDGEAGQEISGEFKNIPPGIFEGQTVVSQELNSTTYEEAQEGVPEYNNEPGPYENTTQRILEGGDDEVIQTTQLPEEVESEELKSLQHSGSSSDYLLLKERMETEQDSRLTTTEDGSFDEDARTLSITDAKELEKPFAEPVIQESGHLPVQEEGQLLDSSMKTGISEKEFETHIDSANNKTTKELQDGTEEFLVEFEVDEGLWDSREADAARGGHEATGAAEEVARFADETLKLLDGEAQKISFFEESENAISSTSRMFSLLGDVAEPGFLKQPFETEPKLLEDHTAETQDATNEMQDAWTGMEETSYGFEENVAEDEMQSKNDTEILNRQVVELATELTTDTDKKESAVIARLESSTHIKAEAQVNTLDTQVQLSEEAQEEILTDTETAEDSMRTESGPKHLTEMSPEEITEQESDGNYTEETGSPVRGHPDMIEEEILDLWIQAALTDETVDTKEQEQKMDTEMEPPNEEQDEIHSEKEHLMESNSLESGLVSDSEISLSTAESGILDQSFGEWGTQNSETWLPESFQGTDHIFASMHASTDISELSIKQQEFEPQDLLIEVTAEAGQSYLKDEESITVTDQESDKLQEKTEEERVESVEVGAASQKDANVMPKMTSPFAVDHTNIEDEPLEITVSDSLSVISSGQSRSGSEDSLQDGIVLTDSGLQGETCVEMKLPSLDEPQALWSEDITEPSSGLIGAEVAQQPRTKSEGQIEVNAPVLDFTAQRSRIAVKNPHVRPPKDPRSLLHMPSVDPTPSTRLPVKVLAGVPLGGMGIGIKLPGLGAGFPVLKKTQRVVRDENNPATSSQESEKKPEEKDDAPKQDEVPQKPKWMPPRHPGFGNPLMSELKTKLKKTTKD